jgi:hypothetical protein
MRIIANSLEIIEEISGIEILNINGDKRQVNWSIADFNGELVIFNKDLSEVYTKEEFIEYKTSLGSDFLRFATIKRDEMGYVMFFFDYILKSFNTWQRELKIQEVLRDENYSK